MIQRHVFVSGLVQGVGYRAATFQKAQEYPGLKGYVRNLPDGRVEAVFCGSEKDVLAMLTWCHRGPRLAKVTDLQVIDEEVDSGLGFFSILRG